MARLHRPNIPLSIRLQVVQRQYIEHGLSSQYANYIRQHRPRSKQLAMFLATLFGMEKIQLDHNPALMNRRQYIRNGKTYYDPPANNPEFLIYRTKAQHDIKTRVRGDGAQLSDLAIARKRKRKARNAQRPKRKWPSRPFPKRVPNKNTQR